MLQQLARLAVLGSLALGAIASLGTEAKVIAASPNQAPPDVQVDTQTGSTTSAPNSPAADKESRFTCQMYSGEYTVMYHPKSQPGQAYAWANPSNMGGGWTPERRCNEISRRLEFYRQDGLQEMSIAVENGYNIICVTTQKNPGCQIVLTVPPGQDPQAIRDRVFQNLTVADSGQTTTGVNTLVGGSSPLERKLNQILDNVGLGSRQPATARNINLRPFLDPADGGTGNRLTGGVPVRSHPKKLNPGNFR